MTEQWQELKETITEMRDNDGTGTQQETCKFLVDYMEVLEKQMQEPCEDCRNCKNWNKCPCGKEGHENGTSIGYSIGECKDYEPCEDCISRESLRRKLQEHHDFFVNAYGSFEDMNFIKKARVDEIDNCIAMVVNEPSVIPQFTDEEIDKAQAVEQAYVDKMVELAVEESRKKWLNSFDTNSATKCFEAVNLLKQRLEGEE